MSRYTTAVAVELAEKDWKLTDFGSGRELLELEALVVPVDPSEALGWVELVEELLGLVLELVWSSRKLVLIQCYSALAP